MRSLPVSIFDPALKTGELFNEAHFQRHLFKLVATTTYYYTDCDQNVYFDGKYWNASGIKYSDLSYAIDQSATTGQLTVPNADKVFSDLILSEDLRSKALTIYRVWLNNSLGVVGFSEEDDLPIVFDGLIERIPRADRKEVQMNIISFGVGGNVICPRRSFEPKCSWLIIGGFTGTFCKYSGLETWCDGSEARCVALSNKENFGGFEHISDLQTKQVLWGQRVKTWGNP